MTLDELRARGEHLTTVTVAELADSSRPEPYGTPITWHVRCETCGWWFPTDNREWGQRKRRQHETTPWTGVVDSPWWSAGRRDG